MVAGDRTERDTLALKAGDVAERGPESLGLSRWGLLMKTPLRRFLPKSAPILFGLSKLSALRLRRDDVKELISGVDAEDAAARARLFLNRCSTRLLIVPSKP